MRSRLINNYARELVKKFPGSFSDDFSKNKEIIRKMEPNFMKKQINELAGYVTRLVKKMKSAE